ncbi:MAG: AI-2E family transporter [Kofleriaceae bacterium]
MASAGSTSSPTPPARRPLVFWAVALGALALVVVVHVAAQALLLTFFGILLATSLRGVAVWLADRLHAPVWVGLALTVVAVLGVSTVAWVWVVPRIIDQATQLADQLVVAYHDLHDRLAASARGRQVLEQVPAWSDHLGYFARAPGVIASTVGVVGSMLFTGFTAIYLAAGPEVYRRGTLRLLPPRWRGRAGEVLDALGRTLRRWLLGRIVSMTAVGVTTTLAMLLLGVPLPVSLGILAGVLGFVPNIGPVVSAVPALLLGAMVGLDTTLYVLVAYVAINLADGFVLTPLLQTRAVETPAALVLLAQLVAGALWGLLGVMLATPLTACALVIVRKVYVEPMEAEQAPSDDDG